MITLKCGHRAIGDPGLPMPRRNRTQAATAGACGRGDSAITAACRMDTPVGTAMLFAHAS